MRSSHGSEDERASKRRPAVGWMLRGLAAALLATGCVAGQSVLVYRLPYENGTDVDVWQDHNTHSPPDKVDLKGVNGASPYAVVAAHTGVVRVIVDDLAANCCGGTCGNNYVWLEHPLGEWSKYSHLATNSVRGDAALSEGDVVLAGQFLGWESNVGRACGSGNGVHLHFETGEPDDPANPLQAGNVGSLQGTVRIPRFCSVDGYTVVQDDVETAVHCDLLLDCIRSIESPSTEGSCSDGLDGEICVHEIQNVALQSTYTRGDHFDSTSLRIDLDWCPNAQCDQSDAGRALHVVVQFEDANQDPLQLTANCQNRQIRETVHGVAEVVIQEAPNLSPENTACAGNTIPDGPFASWEICELFPALVE